MGRAARERVKDATPENCQVSLFRFIKNYWIKMRILMIIDGLPGGGAEKTVLTLSSGLIEMGHQVSSCGKCAITPSRKVH